MHIAPYEQGNRFNTEPLRERKLLMHKREIRKISAAVRQQGMTIVPLSVYINECGICKLNIGICRGKKNYDKREAAAKKDAARKIEQTIKQTIKKH